MKALFFTLLKTFPFWAVPLAIVFAEIGRHFRRRRNSLEIPMWFLVGFLGLLTLLWLIFRGDLHAEKWARLLLGDL